MMRVRFALVGLTATLLLASAARGESAPSEYTSRDYQEGQDRSKAFIPAQAQRVIARLRGQGAKLVGEYPASVLLDVPRAALKRMRPDERPQITVREDFDRILLDAGPIHTRRSRPDPAQTGAFFQRTGKGRTLYLVQCTGPVREEWVRHLDSVQGARRITYLPQNAYLLWASPEAVEEIRQQCTFLQWDGPFLPEYKVHPRLGRRSGRDLDVTLVLVDHPDVEHSLRGIRRAAKRILRPEHRLLGQVVLSLRVHGSEVDQIAQMPDLIGIEPYKEPELVDEVQGQILAGNLTADGNSPTGPGYLGTLGSLGFPTAAALYPIVDVTDTGFDNGSAAAPAHADFYEVGQVINPSRVAYAVDRTADGNPHDVGGHGTINAAIVGGYNDSAGFPHEDAGGFQLGLGLAPHGRVASSKIFRDSGFFGLIGSFTGLVSQSHALGARISTNSWGANTGGDYGSMDQEYDALVRDARPLVSGNQPMAILFAAGNSGPSAGSTGSPGNAKNVITVGAAENVRPAGTDGCGVPNTSADIAQDIAFFSSRGPTDDGRAKPEVVAPGTHVQGAASQDPAFNGSSVCGGATSPYFPAGQTLYTWSSGTSHATPAAAGAAALLYQRFESDTGSAPSPAQVKAMLINATRYLTGAGAGGDLPSNSQGWGEVELTRFLNSARVAKDQTHLFSSTGESFVTTGVVDDSTLPVKVALAWTDPPGPTVGAAYVNDLDLEVTAGGRHYRGNCFQGGFSEEGGMPDTANNAEAVFLPAGTSGNIAARVISTTVAGDGVPGNADVTDQDFALSIQNLLEASVPVPRVTAVTVDDSAGNGNGALDPGETVGLTIEVANDGLAEATHGAGTLSTSTPDVTVTQANSSYPTLAPGGAASNGTLFQIRAAAGIPCGTPVHLTLSLQTDQGTFDLPALGQVGAPALTALLDVDFEGGAAGFTADGLWHLETGCSAVLPGHSPVTTFHYSRTGFCDYNTGATNSGTLTSPEIDLTGDVNPITLSFNHHLKREPGYFGAFDIARVEISTDGGPYATLAGPYDSTGAAFEPVSVDLSGYQGSKIRLRWLFNTVDSLFNNFEGWHVDDIKVEAASFTCAPFTSASSISGTVTSTSGAALSGASMTLVKRNVKPNFKRTTQTDSSGHYQFPDLTPGVYHVTAAKKGYGGLRRKRVTLGASEDKVVDFALKPKG